MFVTAQLMALHWAIPENSVANTKTTNVKLLAITQETLTSGISTVLMITVSPVISMNVAA
jgi:hypothetical protein